MTRATAARARHVLARLAGPWGWCLAGLGLVLLALPEGTYVFPTPGTVLEEGEADELWADDYHARGPTLGVVADAAGDGTDRRHWREVTFVLRGHRFRPPRSTALVDGAPRSADAAWAGRSGSAAWGVALARSFEGMEILDDLPRRYPDDATPPGAWRETRLTTGIVWLAGFPLLWSLARLFAGVTRGWGDPRAAGAWRRAVRPAAWTCGAIGAGLIAFGGGRFDSGPRFGEVSVSAAARRDPFNPGHARFLRVAVERPLAAVPERWDSRAFPEPHPPWSLGHRRFGLHADRRLGTRYFAHRLGGDPDDPDHEERTALDLSLWYALLPAAGWSAVSLWRSRGRGSPASPGRMRPA